MLLLLPPSFHVYFLNPSRAGVTVGSGVAEIDGCNTGKIARPWRLMVLVQRLCDRNPEVGAGPEGSIACLVAEVYREKPLGFVAHGKSRLVCCLCRYAFCSETNHSVFYRYSSQFPSSGYLFNCLSWCHCHSMLWWDEAGIYQLKHLWSFSD